VPQRHNHPKPTTSRSTLSQEKEGWETLGRTAGRRRGGVDVDGRGVRPCQRKISKGTVENGRHLPTCAAGDAHAGKRNGARDREQKVRTLKTLYKSDRESGRRISKCGGRQGGKSRRATVAILWVGLGRIQKHTVLNGGECVFKQRSLHSMKKGASELHCRAVNPFEKPGGYEGGRAIYKQKSSPVWADRCGTFLTGKKISATKKRVRGSRT